MKQIGFLLTILLVLTGCYNTLPQEEEISIPEILQLDYNVQQKVEGMGADGPWIFFNYHFINAEWLQLSLNGQPVMEGSVIEKDVRSGFAFQLFEEVNEMLFTVTIKNRAGQVSQSVTYKKQ